ncbi:MAG: DUF721 domain-containing protein [Candidatus Sericytochromatia bacterium]|nr:DUF721 domain-containing protein [Candidatus Sericytochromatia bacterium]
MKGQPESLAVALKTALPGLNLGQRQKESMAMALWPEVVGPIISEKTRPLYVNRGVLTIQVHSAPWAHQLNLFKSQFLTTLAEKTGARIIHDLRWRIGTSPADTAAPEGPPSRSRRLAPETADWPDLAGYEQQAITAQVKVIEDTRLAERIGAVLQIRRRREHWLRQRGWQPCARCGCLHEPVEGAAPMCPVCAQQGQAKKQHVMNSPRVLTDVPEATTQRH